MSKRGRPSSIFNNIGEKIAVLSLWPDNDTILSFIEIHIGLCEKKIVTIKNRSKTYKILKRLTREGYIEKVDRGRYKAKVKPDEFRLFEYLNQLRESGEGNDLFFEGSVGGTLWKQNDLYFLGMPSEVMDDDLTKFIFSILSIRLSELYQGSQALAQYLMRERSNPGKQPELPRVLLRQLLLEIIPYYVGSHAGIDRDGLSITDLRDLYRTIISQMPETIYSDDWGSSTSKNQISETFETTCELLEISLNSYYESPDYIIEQEYNPNPENKKGNFAIIMTDPIYLIDEDAHQKRTIYHEIIEMNDSKHSEIEIAQSLLLYEQENVLDVLNKYGKLELESKKYNKVVNYYKKMKASHNLALTLEIFEEGYISREELQQLIDDYVSKNISIRDLVYYLPFGFCGMNFVCPHPSKYKIIYEAFPTVPKSKLDKWYENGVAEAKIILEKKLEESTSKLRELLNNKKRKKD